MGEMQLIDEHSLLIAAPPAAVWHALTARMSGWNTRGAAAYARLTGASPQQATGEFPRAGSTLPGFGVSEADPPQRLVLSGSHHFSRYRMQFMLEPRDDGTTRLQLRSYAEFPGVLGQAYRAVVVFSGGHRMVVHRLLRLVRNSLSAAWLDGTGQGGAAHARGRRRVA